MLQVLSIATAGAVGTVLRHVIGSWLTARVASGFPVGTIAVNLIGCFAMGFVAHVLSVTSASPTLRLTLTTGLLGGFTTYSTFNHDTLRLYQSGAPWPAIANVSITVVGGLAAGIAGLAIARKIW